MRKTLAALAVVAIVGALAAPATALSGSATVGSADDRVTRHTYVRHDGGTDAAIELCNSTAPADYGNLTINNEPFSVVDPDNPNLIVAGWNDYCSDWMGLGFSTDGGQTWTNSLVPGYPADDSAEGMQSPEYIRTNNASDPLGAFDGHGHFFFGAISYNGFAGPEDERRRLGGEVRRRGPRVEPRVPARLPRDHPRGQGDAQRELLRQVPRQADARGRPHRRSVRRQRLHVLHEVPRERPRHDLLRDILERRHHVLQADRDQRDSGLAGLRHRDRTRRRRARLVAHLRHQLFQEELRRGRGPLRERRRQLLQARAGRRPRRVQPVRRRS